VKWNLHSVVGEGMSFQRDLSATNAQII